jgi:ankyrin repeat protein
MVDLLVSEYHADIEVAVEDGWRPLHAAYNSTSVVQKLLKAKAKPNGKNKDDETPLYLAVSRGYASVAMTLLENGASPVASSSDKGTPLHAACRTSAGSDLTPFVVAALDADRTPPGLADTESNMDGRTPLSLAVISGQVEVVKLLLQRRDVDINQKDRGGASLFRQAVANKHIEIVKDLMIDPRLTNLDLAIADSAADEFLRDLFVSDPGFVIELCEVLGKDQARLDQGAGSPPTLRYRNITR